MAPEEKGGAGALRNDQSALMFEEGFSFSGYERDPLYLNLGDGRYLNVSGISGIDSLSDGRASVFADFDNDGDLDVFMTTIQGPAQLLFRNNVGQDRGFLRVELDGRASHSKRQDAVAGGRDAFGAVVRIRTAQGTQTRTLTLTLTQTLTQTKIKAGGSGYLSQHDPRLLFGLGEAKAVDGIEVTWPGGVVEHFAGPVPAGTTVRLRQGSGRVLKLDVPRASLPDPETRAEAFARGLKIQVGQLLPVIHVRALDGGATTLQQLPRPGRRLLVNVWATWCVPCLREMPELESLRSRLAARGLDLVGLNVNVNVDVDTELDADVAAFVRQVGVGYPVYIGGVEAVERLYAGDELSVPLSFVVDDKGRVLELIPGWSDATRRRFETLAGEPIGEP